MIVYAAASDVEVVFRPLTDTENAAAAALLAEASVKLRQRVPNVDTMVQADPDKLALAKAAVVNAVCRVLRNPLGYKQRSQTAGIFTDSGTLNGFAASGLIEFPDADLVGLVPAAANRLGTARIRSGYPTLGRLL